MSVRQGKGGAVSVTATPQLVNFAQRVDGEPHLGAHSLTIKNTGSSTVYVIANRPVASYSESTAIQIDAGETERFEKGLYFMFVVATTTGETSTINYKAY